MNWWHEIDIYIIGHENRRAICVCMILAGVLLLLSAILVGNIVGFLYAFIGGVMMGKAIRILRQYG
ncbi:MAG: hypothetical protein ACW99X_18255 [Candidatus Thorarchaeota archaeon]|jgi:hypothetical protein